MNYRIAIIGKGNVGSHLFKAFQGKAEATLVDSHTFENLPAECDMALLCVKDDYIEEVASRLSGRVPVMAHTSGSVEMSVLKKYAPEFGVFYPLQSFTREVPVEYEEIPFFVEASSCHTAEILKEIALSVSGKVVECDSTRRKSLHLASVFACNFTNFMMTQADNILRENGFPIDIILPLTMQTIKKLQHLSPKDSQTGPAVRNDKKVIECHKEMLKDNPDLQNIYGFITDMIIKGKYECDKL